MRDRSRPVDFVVSSMQVLDGKKYKVTILLIEVDERQHNIQIRFRLMPATFASLWQMLV